MSKRAKQKAFRTLRKRGMDFKTAAKLSSLFGKNGYVSVWEAEAKGLQTRSVTLCSCCGPVGLYVLSVDEKKDVAYYLNHGSMFDGTTTTREKFHS